MARTYNGTSDKLVVSQGALTFAPPVTMAAILKRNSTGWNSIIGNRQSSGAIKGWSFEIHPNADANKLTYEYSVTGTDGTATTAVVNADGWVLLVVSKAAGTVAPRFQKFKYSTDVWARENGVSTVIDETPGAGGSVEVGGPWGTSTDWFGGDIAVGAVWNRVLSDTEAATLPYTLAAWLSLAPSALWVLDQDKTTQKVGDMAGGGANESALTGTSVSSGSVPVFNYSDGIWLPTLIIPGGGSTKDVSPSTNLDGAGTFAATVQKLGAVKPGTMAGAATFAATVTKTAAVKPSAIDGKGTFAATVIKQGQVTPSQIDGRGTFAASVSKLAAVQPVMAGSGTFTAVVDGGSGARRKVVSGFAPAALWLLEKIK